MTGKMHNYSGDKTWKKIEVTAEMSGKV